MKTRFLFCLVTLLFAFIPLSAKAEADEAKKFIETLGKEAIETLTNPQTPDDEIEKRFEKFLDRDFALPEIAAFVLGKYNREISSETKQKFLSIFRERLKISYAARFKQYRGVKFNVKSASPAGSNGVAVKSTIQEAKPNAPLVGVEWKVRKINQGWKIFDVSIDGVSMATTLRTEYASAITNRGGLEQFLQSKSANG